MASAPQAAVAAAAAVELVVVVVVAAVVVRTGIAEAGAQARSCRQPC